MLFILNSILFRVYATGIALILEILYQGRPAESVEDSPISESGATV